MKKSALALILMTSLGLANLACSSDDSHASEMGNGEAPAEAEAVPVEVTTLSRGAIESILRFSTHLEAEGQVKVLAQTVRQVRELGVEEGDRVSRNQLLARLQDDEQKIALAKVESQLARAQREYERQKRLYASELISEEAFNQATYEIDQLELALDEAQQALAYTEVRAPIAGTITQRWINLGDHVTINQPLFEIVDFDSIVARVFVPEKELIRLARGQLARVSAPALGGRTFRGKIERLAPVIDPGSGTLKVTVDVLETGGLRPGMYVEVHLVTETVADALLVPKRALVYDQDQLFVYRLRDDRSVERLPVRPRLEDREFVVPAAGFAAGDRLVVAGQAGLKDGARVRLVAPAEATEGTP